MCQAVFAGENSECGEPARSPKTAEMEVSVEMPISGTCELAQTWILCFRQLSQST